MIDIEHVETALYKFGIIIMITITKKRKRFLDSFRNACNKAFQYINIIFI